MGQALYRKHRPRTLKEVVGQEHVTHTLEQALKQGRISHAYLFTGPRGVGKTSIARILAHEINGLPYDDDSAHIDIIEIDAASNRRIDEIREIREKVYVAPVNAKYKVYIIDEVHMLTKEAFNALLKTLEEPPAHVVFILATTEAHKLPDTIVSRTQRFTFKPVEASSIASHLADLAKEEGINITPEALDLLAEHGEGSFRDSISLLDQLGSHGPKKKVEAEDVRRLLGIPPAEAIDALISALGGDGGVSGLMSALDSLLMSGYQPSGIAKLIGRRLRDQLVEGRTVLAPDATLDLIGKLIEVPSSHDPARFLELVLLEARPITAVQAAPPAAPKPPSKAKEEPASPPKPEPKAEETSIEPLPAEESQRPGPQPKAPPAGEEPLDDSLWPKVLKTLKSKHNTLYGVVRMAKPALQDDTLTLTFGFAFHEKRIKESANSRKLADVIYELTGRNVKVECVLDKSAGAPDPAEAPEPAKSEPGPQLDAISNIFGTAELLES